MAEVLIALDIGGTKLAAGVVNLDGRLLDRSWAATPTDGDGEALFHAVAELLDRYRPFSRFLACGVGCPGPMIPGGEQVSPLNIEAWRAFPLRPRLAAHTGLPVGVDNDGKALALAEGWVGAAVDESDYLSLVVSTGIGGGIVVDRRLLEGAAGNAGHIGHMVACRPGRELPGHITGGLEAEASGTAIAAHTGRPAQEATTAVVAEAGTLVGGVAGSVVNLLDLRLVTVAGSVALGFGEPFFAAAQAEMDRVCGLDYSRGVRIVPSGCGDEGPLVGAAAVGLRSIGRPVGVVAGRPVSWETFSSTPAM